MLPPSTNKRVTQDRIFKPMKGKEIKDTWAAGVDYTAGVV